LDEEYMERMVNIMIANDSIELLANSCVDVINTIDELNTVVYKELFDLFEIVEHEFFKILVVNKETLID
jgi:hypothetical protein